MPTSPIVWPKSVRTWSREGLVSTAAPENVTPQAYDPARILAAVRVATRSISRDGSAREADSEQHVDRAEPVAPGDLLALVVAAAVVRDRQLVDPQVALADLARDLGLDAEAVLTQVERAE